jgi:hypothetical protein
VKIPYYVTRQHAGRPKWGYWAPCLKRRNPKTGNIEPSLMAQLSFKLVDCGQDGPRAWAIAQSWNAKWHAARKAHRAGEIITKPGEAARVYPLNSLGEAYQRIRRTGTFKTKAPATQESWARGWRHIDPIFGDVDPSTIGLEDMDLWYSGDSDNDIDGLLTTVGVSEAYHAMKIWRALWKMAGTLNRPAGGKYCDSNADPSLGIRRKTPKPRSAVWREGEAVRLVKRAWRMEKYGLACIMAVAWDSMLSPVDNRMLTPAQLRGDAEGPFFELARAKTGKVAIGTLSKRTLRLIKAYREIVPYEVFDTTPMFRTAGAAPGPKGGRRWLPQAYSKDKLGRDFRDVVAAEFPGDTRKLADFRRSGAKEAELGGVETSVLGRKMANNIDTDAKLRETYLPGGRQDASIIRLADAARGRGRKKLRGGGGSGAAG